MRETGTGVRIAGRSLHVGLRAGLGPPARRVFLRIAHLHTAASGAGFRAVAIASPGANTAQQCGRIRQHGDRAGKQDDPRTKQLPKGGARW